MFLALSPTPVTLLAFAPNSPQAIVKQDAPSIGRLIMKNTIENITITIAGNTTL